MSTFHYTDIEASDRTRAVKYKDGSKEAKSSGIKRKERPTPLDQEKIHLQHDALDRSQLISGSPRAPEIVDLAAPTSWSRRTMTRIPSRDMAPSPGAQSKLSVGRQSEMSFGILDYYTGDASPCCSPTVPATSSTADSAPKTSESQKTDPAIEHFDFGLKSSTPTQPRHHDTLPQRPRAKTLASESDTKAGADRAETSTVASPPTSVDRSIRPTLHKKTYSLFPSPTVSANRVPQIPTTPKAAAQPPATPTSNHPVSTPPHQQPNPAFRPRKESLPRSMRSRKDSMISHRSSDRQIPLRILSSSTTASASSTTTPKTDYYNASSTTPVSANSPPDRSRWSDETIASPTATTVRDGGPRTSFGSLLGAVGGGNGSDNSDQYPACFFEDDDEEAAPLKRKLAWKKWSTGSSPSTQGGRRREKGGRLNRSDRGDPTGWRKVTRVLLCGGCGGAAGRVRGV
ncbi:hypothetical protein D0869_02610 [Hortaea werneckii]|uniref:Uncharacterized protein n=1 Tax=Hortaea werneckii TaxID=91943 RepID=A0A3M6X889_HORWE|nr:hypothetical protein KC324_g12925 [Hortaea werneckii]KAI7560731.1 hypothetical protein KC316_g12944 [Hortaea werneckii]RMX87095.1 hypothetical protein D0869_02610 [Hortaea werneckii]